MRSQNQSDIYSLKLCIRNSKEKHDRNLKQKLPKDLYKAFMSSNSNDYLKIYISICA